MSLEAWARSSGSGQASTSGRDCPPSLWKASGWRSTPYLNVPPRRQLRCCAVGDPEAGGRRSSRGLKGRGSSLESSSRAPISHVSDSQASAVLGQHGGAHASMQQGALVTAALPAGSGDSWDPGAAPSRFAASSSSGTSYWPSSSDSSHVLTAGYGEEEAGGDGRQAGRGSPTGSQRTGRNGHARQQQQQRTPRPGEPLTVGALIMGELKQQRSWAGVHKVLMRHRADLNMLHASAALVHAAQLLPDLERRQSQQQQAQGQPHQQEQGQHELEEGSQGWAAGGNGSNGSTGAKSLFPLLEELQAEHMASFKARQAANSLWAWSKLAAAGQGLSYQPPAHLLGQLLGRLQACVGSARPQELSSSLYAAATLQLPLSPSLMQGILRGCDGSWAEFKPQELANLLWAAGHMAAAAAPPQPHTHKQQAHAGHSTLPPAWWLAQLLQAQEPLLARSSPEELASSCWGLSQLVTAAAKEARESAQAAAEAATASSSRRRRQAAAAAAEAGVSSSSSSRDSGRQREGNRSRSRSKKEEESSQHDASSEEGSGSSSSGDEDALSSTNNAAAVQQVAAAALGSSWGAACAARVSQTLPSFGGTELSGLLGALHELPLRQAATSQYGGAEDGDAAAPAHERGATHAAAASEAASPGLAAMRALPARVMAQAARAAQAQQLSARAASHIMHEAARLKLQPGPKARAWLGIMLGAVVEGRPNVRDISHALYACAMLQCPPSLSAVHRLLQAAQAGMEAQPPASALACLLWSAAKLRLRLPASFLASFQRASYAARSDFTPEEVASIFSALGALRVRPGRKWLHDVLAGVCRSVGQYQTFELAQVVQGLGRIGFVPSEEWAEWLVSELQGRLSSEPTHPRVAIALLCGLATLLPCSSVASQWVQEGLVGELIVPYLPILGPADVACVMWGCARMQRPMPEDSATGSWGGESAAAAWPGETLPALGGLGLGAAAGAAAAAGQEGLDWDGLSLQSMLPGSYEAEEGEDPWAMPELPGARGGRHQQQQHQHQQYGRAPSRSSPGEPQQQQQRLWEGSGPSGAPAGPSQASRTAAFIPASSQGSNISRSYSSTSSTSASADMASAAAASREGGGRGAGEQRAGSTGSTAGRRASVLHPDVSAALMQACDRVAPQLSPKQMSMVLYAMPCLGLRPSRSLLTKLMFDRPHLLPAASDQDLAMAIYVLGGVRMRPPAHWLEPYLEEVSRRSGRLNSRMVSGILRGLSALNMSPGEAWVSHFVTASAPALRRMVPQQLTMSYAAAADLEPRLAEAWGFDFSKLMRGGGQVRQWEGGPEQAGLSGQQPVAVLSSMGSVSGSMDEVEGWERSVLPQPGWAPVHRAEG